MIRVFLYQILLLSAILFVIPQLAAAAPNAPLNPGTACNQNGSARLFWWPPSSGSTPTNYPVRIKPLTSCPSGWIHENASDPTECDYDSNTSTYIDTSVLAQNTTYTAWVQSYNSTGWSSITYFGSIYCYAPYTFRFSELSTSVSATRGSAVTNGFSIVPTNDEHWSYSYNYPYSGLGVGSGGIHVSVSGIPSGASYTYTPVMNYGQASNSMFRDGSDGIWTLTINTGTAAAGTYTITVNGTASDVGSVTKSTTFTLTITAPAPTANLSASPSSINSGHSSTLTWSSTNATSCTGTNFSTGGATSGSILVTPSATTLYSVNCTGSGGSASASQTITVVSATPTCSVTFSANPIASGSSATLSYSSTNATTFYINSIGYVGASGSTTVSPLSTTNYSGTVTGTGGNGSCPATLTVTPPPIPVATITASSTSIQVGQSTGLKATFVAGSGDVLTGDNIDSPVGTGLGADTNPSAAKYITFTPSSAGTYTFYARATTQYYTSWTTYATVSVTVTAPPISCSLSLAPSSITSGQGATLSWTSTNATAGTISSVGSVGTSGSTTVTPSNTTTYTGTFTGPSGSGQCTATENVTCTPTYSCASTSTIQYTDSSCTTSTYATCASPSFCSSGSSVCLFPQATSTLQVLPTLVKAGNTAQVTWLSQNVTSCSVSGSNGDAWSGASGTQTSSGILNKTVYTLSCIALDGSTTTQQGSVTILPKFCETGASNCN